MSKADFVLRDGQAVVLIGDSITDCARRAEHAPMGNGYVQMIAALSAAKYPQRKIDFINSGVNGNTIEDLAERWDQDVLAHRPDWISVMIGVNDLLRKMEGRGGVPIDQYGAIYRELLERTRAALSGCGFILMAPGIVRDDLQHEGNKMIQTYGKVVRELAKQFDAFFVPVYDAFAEVIASGRPRQWTDGGCHPNADGHGLVSLAWLNTLHW